MPTAPRRIVRRPSSPPEASRSPSPGLRVKVGTGTAKRPPEAPTGAPRGRTTKVLVKPSGKPTANGKATAPSGGDQPRFKGGLLSTMPAAGGGLWNLKKGSTKLRLLSEPEPTDHCPDDAVMHWYEQYWDEADGHYRILTDGEEPPAEYRRQTRFAVAAYDRTERADDDRVKIYSLPYSLLKDISKQFGLYTTVCDVDCIIDNEGQGKNNTTYSVTFLREGKTVKNLVTIRDNISIPNALQDERNRLATMAPRAPKKLDRAELIKLTKEDFIALAHSLDIVTKGKTKGEVVDEILETQD